MPWQVSDVDRFKKGLGAKDKERWAAIANSVLQKCLDEGGDRAECERSAIMQASGSLEEQRGQGQGMDGEPQGDGGVEKCVCPECGHEMDHERGTPCNEIECPECGATMGPEMEESMDLTDLRELLTQALDLVDSKIAEQEPEIAEAELAESASGYAIGLAEVADDNGNRAPVEFDLKIIAPGAGNKHDNHWYPADMLRRDAHVFEGVDMFVTDHRENERSERTKAGKIKSIVGFTEDGGPIGRAVVYDPDMAEKIRNRAVAGELETLHCSILASGTAKKGKIDGKQYHIVEAIGSASAVDLVSRAGAGGKALALAESENGGEPMAEEEQVIEEQEPTEEPLEEVTLQEQQEEPEESPPEPAMLDQERVREMVGESNLPAASKARLSETAYADEGSVEDAIKAEIAYVKEITGSGKPFAQGAGDPPPEHRPRTVEEADADFERILSEVGMPHLVGG